MWENKDTEPEILSVIRGKETLTNRIKKYPPLIFKLKIKKGTEPVYTNYSTVKEKFPALLISFLEKKIHFNDTHSHRTERENQILTRQKHKSPASKKKIELKENILIEKIAENWQSEGDFKKQWEPQIEYKNPSNQKKGNVEYLKILDYDQIVEELGHVNLISPAVIPMKVKQQSNREKTLYQTPMRINFKEAEREHYSSQEYKESQYSQFLLDQKAQEKKRRERMQREQEKLTTKGKKTKRIKRKKKKEK